MTGLDLLAKQVKQVKLEFKSFDNAFVYLWYICVRVTRPCHIKRCHVIRHSVDNAHFWLKGTNYSTS